MNLRQTLSDFVRHYLVALQGATRVPVSPASAQHLAQAAIGTAASAAHLPGVGLLLGVVACIVFATVSLLLPDTPLTPLVAAIAGAVATLLLTGAADERGLVRTADRLGAAPAGLLALVLLLAAKLALLGVMATQSAAGVLAALLAGHAVSRFWPLALGYALPFAPGQPVLAAAPVAAGAARIGALWCVPPLALMLVAGGPAFVLVAVALSGLALYAVLRTSRKRLQGATADTLGAAQQACEAAFYLGAAIGLRG